MSKVVALHELEDGIVLIAMEDRVSRNTFSKELVAGLLEAFQHIAGNPNYKVVVLTGYDNYFCCGGTKEELISIFKGEIKFNDIDFFTLPLECRLPVIAAMQGHGIGAGLVFGLYADFPVMAKESIYSANFMRYGFTPGVGGTMMLPLKLGEVLGSEMLYTAGNYRGGQLKERGVQLKVFPRADVLKEALSMARELAEKPRQSLIILKEHLTRQIKAGLPEVIERELKMHEISFHLPEVGERINTLFGR
ncbi:enoyl-CoA hydratase [Chitinophaga varians]|uniref:Enoyl-CoA hydratase n=1 Tax=Chitinophaga varians TaxID=2202339 RepID=A0A847S774_9BACT|nr:polyketide synthase [Chitinophaga varians]NLR69205.1 enoyl-CoA hydratase [Chitinophaga varians]